MKIDDLIEGFINWYGDDGEILRFFAPGRVNLIGDHTDYNGGYVFPCALSFGTYALARRRKDAKVRLISQNFLEQGMIEVEIFNLSYDEKHNWANYPKGVIETFIEAGHKINQGLDIMFYGNIPNGAGLSSSASIELVTSLVLKVLFKLEVNMLEMIKLSQHAENRYIGVNCGIMDQFTIGMGKRDHALLLNTNTLSYEYVPIKLEDIAIVIANTNKRRDLAASKYNERRYECEEALIALQQKLKVSTLAELTEMTFEENKYLIPSDIFRKRAKHVIYENQRTIKAVEALKNGNIKLFGSLMNESHISLRDDYEVSCTELDTLVAAAWKNGAIGSRMTGAGFGGCTVSLVNHSKAQDFIEQVGLEYEALNGVKADFYIASIGDGTIQI